MLKKPGTFSNKYMSNPNPRISFLKDRNKQNKNIHNTLQHSRSQQKQQQHDKNQQKIDNRNISTKKITTKAQNRHKLEWQKYQKQLNMQMMKIKKQNQRLRDDVRKLNKTIQENICQYEKYTKQLETQRNLLQNKLVIYSEQLKYCIIWIIQTFSLSQNSSKHVQLFQNKLCKDKMKQMFKKLTPTIQELQIEKKIIQRAKNQINQSQYLIYQRQSKGKNSTQHGKNLNHNNQNSFQQFKDLFDTFDLHKQEFYEQAQQQQPQDAYNQQNIARKLFVNEDTFGQQIGQHNISQQSAQNQQAFVVSQSKLSLSKSKFVQNFNGAVVKIVKYFKNQCEDYLQVNKGDEVKLLRKVGDLWIAQNGCKIGYISEDTFI